MDMEVLAAMLFVLLLVAMVGGFILLLPITRRLGLVLEDRLGDRRQKGDAAAELRQLRAAVQALQAQVAELSERQDFAEALLAERRPASLPESPGGSA